MYIYNSMYIYVAKAVVSDHGSRFGKPWRRMLLISKFHSFKVSKFLQTYPKIQSFKVSRSSPGGADAKF